MTRRRPGGITEKSTRFAEYGLPDGTKLKIPVVKDAATFVYVADENGKWPKSPAVTLLIDLNWMAEGVVFGLEEMRPGHNMGSISTMQAIAVYNIISRFPGKYGQLKRLVLVRERKATNDDIENLTLDDLKRSLEGGNL